MCIRDRSSQMRTVPFTAMRLSMVITVCLLHPVSSASARVSSITVSYTHLDVYKRQLLDLFDQLHLSGHTVVLITHDPFVAARADRDVYKRQRSRSRWTPSTPRAATP